MQAAEKTYMDFEVTTTNPGGHSSRPGPTNAIYDLARIVDRLAAFRFPPKTNEITKAYFKAAGAITPAPAGPAMLRYADDPDDKEAYELLASNPEYVGQVGTTCVATMLRGGHAPNALPQSATVDINCRVFPGESVEYVQSTLTKVIDDPKAQIKLIYQPVPSDASPLREDVMKALRKAIDLRAPGLPIVPSMSAGATDSLYFRNAGVPSYGVGGLFISPKDSFSHGLNERIPVASIDGAVVQWRSLIRDLVALERVPAGPTRSGIVPGACRYRPAATTIAAPANIRAPGTVCQTIQSMHAPHTMRHVFEGRNRRRRREPERLGDEVLAGPAVKSQAARSRSSRARRCATQPRAARAPAPRAVSSRNQNTIEAVVSVAAMTRTITTTMAQHTAAASAASPARLAKPEAVGFRITSTPARPARIAAQTCHVRLLAQEQRGEGHDEQRRAQRDRIGVRKAHAGERPHEAPEHQDREHRPGQVHRDAARAQLRQAPGDGIAQEHEGQRARAAQAGDLHRRVGRREVLHQRVHDREDADGGDHQHDAAQPVAWSVIGRRQALEQELGENGEARQVLVVGTVGVAAIGERGDDHAPAVRQLGMNDLREGVVGVADLALVARALRETAAHETVARDGRAAEPARGCSPRRVRRTGRIRRRA